jgi:hypothetical protein
MWLENFDIYYSGYIQTHCQKNKKIERADQILPEVYGTTLSGLDYSPHKLTHNSNSGYAIFINRKTFVSIIRCNHFMECCIGK